MLYKINDLDCKIDVFAVKLRGEEGVLLVTALTPTTS